MVKNTILFALFLGFLFVIQSINAQNLQSTITHKNQFSISGQDKNSIQFENILNKINYTTIETQQGSFTYLSIEGYNHSQVLGDPLVPVYTKLIEIPLEAEVKITYHQVLTEEIDLDDFGFSHPLVPKQPPVPKNLQGTPDFVINKKTYSRNAFIFTEKVKLVELGVSRGVRIARLEVYPVQYKPRSNKIKLIKELDFELEFKHANHQKTRSEQQRYYSPVFHSTFSQLINKQYRDLISTSPMKYIIVADTMFQQSLQSYVQWKKRKGFMVVEAYTSDPNVGNTSASIKAFLKSHYNNATASDPAPTYILLVGDIAEVPSFSGVTGGHVTDLYYAEYTNDFIPDAYFGRFSAGNVQDLLSQIDKTLSYEQYQMSNPAFLDDIILIAGVDGSYSHTHANGQVNYAANEYYNTANGFTTHLYLYPNSGNQETQILQDVSAGASLINYTAHGSAYGWVDPAFGLTDINGLTNTDKYPLMIGNACSTNSFNATTCFGEALLRANKKGAIGYIGASNSTYWDEDFHWAVGDVTSISANPTYAASDLGMFDRLMHQNSESYAEWFTSQGQIVYAGNMAVMEAGSYDYDYYWEIYHLMGDPSLAIYLGVPSAMTATFPGLVPLGSTNIQVSTEPFAYIGISSNGVLHGAAFADTFGNAQIPIDPFLVPGEGEIIISAQNKQPYIDTFTIATPQSAYILGLEYDVVDFTGNNNGKADYSETVNLNVTLKNYGLTVDSTVYCKLSVQDSNVQLLDSIHYWGFVDAGDTAKQNNAFSFSVNTYVPDQHQVTFFLNIYDSAGNTWQSDFMVPLHAPNLAVTKLVVDDMVNGNGNSVLDPGEIVTLKFLTENNGHSDAMNTMGQLSSNSPDISIQNASYTFDTLPVNATDTASFDITVSSGASLGDIVTINFFVNAGSYNTEANYQFIVGPAIEDWETGDKNKFHWTDAGNNAWGITTDAYEGSYALKSGSIGGYQQSEFSISLDVLNDDSISFYRKVSSEANYDFFEFYIDAQQLLQLSGEQSWAQEAFAVSAGLHTFTWIYNKDVYVDEGSDCAWVDYIMMPPFASNTTGINIEYIQDNFLIKAYPNPVKSNLSLDFELSENSRIQISLYSIIGKKLHFVEDMKGSGLHHMIIPMQDIQEGIYILLLETEEYSKSFKIIRSN